MTSAVNGCAHSDTDNDFPRIAPPPEKLDFVSFNCDHHANSAIIDNDPSATIVSLSCLVRLFSCNFQRLTVRWVFPEHMRQYKCRSSSPCPAPSTVLRHALCAHFKLKLPPALFRHVELFVLRSRNPCRKDSFSHRIHLDSLNFCELLRFRSSPQALPALSCIAGLL